MWLDRECGSESESYLARLRMWPVMFKLPLLLLLPLLLPQAAVKGLTLEGSSTSYAQVPEKKNILCRGAQTIEQEITLFLTQFKKWFIGSNSSLEMEFRTKQR